MQANTKAHAFLLPILFSIEKDEFSALNIMGSIMKSLCNNSNKLSIYTKLNNTRRLGGKKFKEITNK